MLLNRIAKKTFVFYRGKGGVTVWEMSTELFVFLALCLFESISIIDTNLFMIMFNGAKLY